MAHRSIFYLFTIVSLFTSAGCIPPKALLYADADPRFAFSNPEDTTLYIGLKDQTVEEKKFSYLLSKELENRGYKIIVDDKEADFQLVYALDLENYKTKEYILLSNPEFVSGTFNGRGFAAQRNSYRYAPVERAYAYKEVFLDLYRRAPEKPEKVWSGRLKAENKDYRTHVEACVEALVEAIGKDVSRKVTLRSKAE